MHQLHRLFAGLVHQPQPHIVMAHVLTHPNPAYGYWLRFDQLLRAWLFTTIPKDKPGEVRDLQHSLPVWQPRLVSIWQAWPMSVT